MKNSLIHRLLAPLSAACLSVACLVCMMPITLRAAPVAAELFTDDGVTRFEIVVAPEDLEDLGKTQKFKGMGERKSYAVTVREGGRTYSRVAMHLKGAIGSFRPIDKNPALTLSFDKHVRGQRFHGLEKISLNNSVQDPTRISERFSRELYRRAGIPAPRAGLATVKLNGSDLGVYLLIEGYNRQFLKQHFPNADGNLYDGGLGEEIDAGGKQPVNSGRHPTDQRRLQQLIAAARDPDLATRFGRLAQVLDLDRFISLTALDVIIGNWDGYALGRNNYRIFDNLATGKLVFLPHGLDQTFQNPDANILPRMPGLVARALMETPEGSGRYLERMTQLTEKLFDVNALTNRAQQIAAVARRELTAQNPNMAQEHDQSVDSYCAHIAQRAASLRRQLAGARQPVRFDAADTALLAGWAPRAEFGNPTFGDAADSSGSLRIQLDSKAAIAAWNSKVWLPKGRYRFEGSLKTIGLVPVFGDPRGGAGLRIGNRRISEPILGDQDWQPARFEFEVLDPLYEIELRCECRATDGEVFFERASLRLIRLAAEE